MDNTDLMLYEVKVGQKFKIVNCRYTKFIGKIFTVKEFKDTNNIRIEVEGYGMLVTLRYLKKYCIKMEEQMNNTLQMEINKISEIFEKSFINRDNELILVPATNCFFGLYDVSTVEDLKCKFIEWVTRHTFSSKSKYWENYTKKRYMEYLEQEFSNENLRFIYNKLGNRVNRKLCREFIQSDFDLYVLED